MANIKCVHIHAKVPCDYISKLPDEDVVFLAHWLLTPAVGLRYCYKGTVEWRPNEHGGQTAIELIEIEGLEAINYRALDRFKEIFQKVGEIVLFSADDLEFEAGARCSVCGFSFARG